MLHTLNKAWAKILARRANDRILFVVATPQEQQMLSEVFSEVEKEIGNLCLMWVVDKNTAEEYMLSNIAMEMQDDILVSHEIHDCMLKDFLSRHCKRKCC